MFYLLSIPAILVQLAILYKLNLIRRADQAMFRLCAFNSELIAFLDSKVGQELSLSDYVYTRSLLESNEHSIAQFNEVVRKPFTFKAVLRGVRYVDNKIWDSQSKPETAEASELLELYHKMVHNLSQSILNFNPLLKYKLFLALVVLVGEAAAQVGMRKARRWTIELSERVTHIINEELIYNKGSMHRADSY